MAVIDRLASLTPIALVAAVAYCACLSLYRIFLHPLAKVPGHWLAAISCLPEFYYDVVQDGQYLFKIKEWHQRYGPLLRIGPNIVHCNDPAFIDQIYAGSGSGKKRDKTVRFARAMGTPHAGLATLPHDHHRLRRGALNKFFSTSSVRKIEPFIKERLDKICYYFENHYSASGQASSQQGKTANLSDALSSMSVDVVSEFVFGFSFEYTSSPTFLPNLHNAISAASPLMNVSVYFPWVISALSVIPESVTVKMNPDLSELIKYMKRLEGYVDNIRDAWAAGTVNKSRMSQTMLTDILDSSLPEEEKTKERFIDEGFALIGAGTETTSAAVSVGSYYLLAQPDTLEKLLKELEVAIPDPEVIPTWVELEKLPYLGAVIQESVRLAYGVVTRLERIPHEALAYHGSFKGKDLEVVLPPGTILGMSTGIHHHNEDVFPDSYAFKPERWLDENGNRRRELDSMLLSFSKGSRQCVGINLAYAEMYLSYATLFRRFGRRMQLVDTPKAEVELASDRILPWKKSNKGIKVSIKAPQS